MSTSGPHSQLPSSSTVSSLSTAGRPKLDARRASVSVPASLNPLACLGYRKQVATQSSSPDLRASTLHAPRQIPRERTGSTAKSSPPPQTPTASSASSLASFAAARGPLASIRNKLRTRSSTGSLRPDTVISGSRPATINISHPRPLRPRLCSSASSTAVPLSPPVLPLPPLRTLRHSERFGEFGELRCRKVASASLGSPPSRRAPSLSDYGGRDLPSFGEMIESGPHARFSIHSTYRLTASSSRISASPEQRPSLIKRRRDQLDEGWQWVGVSLFSLFV